MAGERSRMPKSKYWLFKSDPDEFGIDDLETAPDQTTCWDGIRNYQARNYLRDSIRAGDGVLFYHSSTIPMGIVGTARVVRAGYPDHTAWDPNSPGYDRGCRPDDPTWFMIDIRIVNRFRRILTRDDLAHSRPLAGMVLLKRGSRLSIQPVTPQEWRVVHELAGLKPW